MASATSDQAAGFSREARWVSIFLGSFGVIGGIVSFLGWAAGLPALTNWGATEGISIRPNTAVSIAFAGGGLILLSVGYRRYAAALAVVPILLAGFTLVEYVTGIDLHLSGLFSFVQAWGLGAEAPARMGPPAALSLVLLGAGLVLSAFGPRLSRAAPLVAVAAVGVVLFSLIGYLFGASALFSLPRLTAIAFPATLMLFALAMGLIFALPDHEPMHTLQEDSGAGVLARQSLPLVMVLPVGLAYLRLQGERAGLYDAGMGTSMLVVVLIILLIVLLWRGVEAVRARESSQRLVEVALREREAQLQEADRRKDEFIATLAHELRNPMAPISNALAILHHGKADSTVLVEARDMMERQVSHMVRLIDDLLDVSRISRGKLELRTQSIDLAAVLQQAVETCRPLIDQAYHYLSLELPGEPVTVKADPIRLTQVFGNLISNACKFTPPGGRIRVAAWRVGEEVLVAVEDNGAGIPPGHLKRIFEIFAQVDGTLERSQGGLGIGLTLAKRVVELHGGSIAATSDGAGKGSRFEVRLPIEAKSAQSPAQDAHEPPVMQPSARHRILVVDDNRDNAESLALLLKLSGNETHTAHDGAEAVEAAARLQPDAVLLDIGLPRLNGYEACRRIRQQLHGSEVSIFALTGWGQEADRRKSIEAGFDGHFVKPVDGPTLTRILGAIGKRTTHRARPAAAEAQPLRASQ